MGYGLTDKSIAKLTGVHSDLQRVVVAACKRLDFQVVVTEGVRTLQRQRDLYAQGRAKPGKIVTGTMKSRHLTGHAVDLAPEKSPGVIDWNNTKRFLEIGKAMKDAATNEKIPIRWGYDWDGDGVLQEKGEYDGPHFELLKKFYPD